MSVLLSIAMVLNSTPIRAYAEEVNEPQAIVEEAAPEGEEAEVPSDESEAGEENTSDGEAPDEQAADVFEAAAPLQLTTQADDNVYTIQYLDQEGAPISGMPDDVKSANPHLFTYLTDADGNILGWACVPFDQSTSTATLPGAFNKDPYTADGAVAYDPNAHTVKARVVRGSVSGGDVLGFDWGKRTYDGSVSWNGKDQFDGYKFVPDSTKPMLFTMQKDWNKSLVVDLSYFGSDTGESAPATIIVRGKGATTGWHYYKLPPSNVNWNEGVGQYDINEWYKKDGSSFGVDDYSDSWQNVEAVLFAGDVSIQQAAQQLEDQGKHGIPYLAGYIIKSGERTDGDIDHEAGTQKIILPVVFDSTPLDKALTPEEVLGDAHEFGIVADTYNQSGHTETNCAVKHFNDNSNLDFEGSAGKKFSDVPFYIGELQNVLKFGQGHNADAYVYIPQSEIDKGKIMQDAGNPHEYEVNVIPTSYEEISDYVDGMIDDVKHMSETMAAKTTIKPAKVDNGKVVIDATLYPDNTTIYVDCSNIMNKIAAGGDLQIHKHDGQTIVFNIPDSGAVTIGEFAVWTDKYGHEDGDKIASTTGSPAKDRDAESNLKVNEAILEHIIFNMPNASSVLTNNSSAMFLAPNADTFEQKNGAGWIVCGGTVNSDSEWHFYRRGRHFDASSGSLKINKRLGAGAPDEAKNKEYKFYVYKETSDGRAYYYNNDELVSDNTGSYYLSHNTSPDPVELTITGAGSYKLSKLEPGEYHVIELVDKAQIAGYTLTVTNGESTVKLSGGGTKYVTVTNTYEKKTETESGQLTVTKSVTPADAATAAGKDAKFTVTIKNAEGKYLKADGTLSETEVTHTVTPGSSLVIKDVPLGTYNVTETSKATVEGWTFTAEGSTTTGSATIAANGDEKTVALINAYEQDGPSTGSIAVTKTVLPAEAATAAGEKSFGVIIKSGDKFLNASGELVDEDPQLAVSAGKTLTIGNVPLGDYTVTESETGRDIDGWTFKELTTGGAASLTDDGDTAIVTLTNTYEKQETPVEKGKIVIHKATTGLPEGTDLSSLSFTITGPNDFSKTVSYADFTDISDQYDEIAGTVAEYELGDLELGETYEVIENGAEDLVSGYSLTASAATEGDALATKDGDSVVRLRNSYVRDTGSLTIAKVVEGVDTGVTVDNEFQVTITNVAGKYLNASGKLQDDEVKLTLKAGVPLKFENLPTDTYTVTEANENLDIDGYFIKSAGVIAGDGVVAKNGAADVTVTNTYEKTSIKVSKNDIVTGKEIAGATIQILDENGDVVDGWISTADDEETDTNEGVHVIEGLKTGVTYTLHEVVAPDGYTIASDTTFAIDSTGKVTTTGTITKDGVLLVNDSLTKVSVSKVDIADGEELAGAHIQLLDKDGGIVQEWDSTTEAHEIVGLKTGVTYTLHETVAPDGYTIASDTTFTIDQNGKVTSSGTVTTDGVILVKDAKTTISVSKADIADGSEVAGAHIQIIETIANIDGSTSEKVVTEWDSTTKAHVVTGLKTGVTYTLRETVAPDGYAVTTDTTFVIDETGKVTATAAMSEDGTILVKDGKTKVKVSKTDIASGEELEGATIQILKENGDIVTEWVSSTEAHEIEGLKTGVTYTLRETVAPDGYTVASDTTFTLTADGNVITEATISTDGAILIEDSLTKVSVSKVDIADGEELAGAHIQLLDKDGGIVQEWDSTDKPHEIVGLKTGVEYTLHETVAPDGYTIASDTTFTIDQNGKVTSSGTVTDDGVILVEDAKTKVSVSKVDIADGAEVSGAHIQLLDKDGGIVQEWDSTDKPHEIVGLKTGVEYTLHETAAPNGYDVTTDIKFSIDKTGKVNTEADTSEDGAILVQDTRLTGTATITLKKKVTTNIPWTATEDFEFTLATEDGTAIETIKVKADEEKSFSALKVDKPGTYFYTITETKGSTPHVTYDTATKWAKVEAKSNAAKKCLDTTVKYGASKDSCTEDSLVITNEYAAPALEKYINKDVHQDLPAFDTPFTYDILAFVTRDANSVTITDPLVQGVRFLDGNNTQVTVQDIGPDNDHTAHGTVEQAAGRDITFTANVDSAHKTLTVDIPDANGQNLRGHWVRVTYRVILDNHVVSDTPHYKENDVDIDANGTVISKKFPTHDGVETSASYVVQADNGDYQLNANHITVTPPTETFKVTKKWLDANGKAAAWPKDAKVTIELYGNGKPLDEVTSQLFGADKTIGRMTIELSASKTSGTFAALPIYESITYSVVETKVENVTDKFSVSVTGDDTQGFTVTNTFDKKDEKKTESKSSTSSTSTSSTKLPKTGDPSAAGFATLFLSGLGSAMVTTGYKIRKRRNKR